MRICVVVPVYNEEKTIHRVLSELLAAGFHVVVADDCSEDKTADIARRLPVHYLRHWINLGQGAALRSGTQLAERLGYDVIIHFDADGQHRTADAQLVVRKLIEKNLDVVIGSRFLQTKSELPVKKKIVLWLASVFSRKVLKLNFTDPQSGLRAFRTDVMEKLMWKNDDFSHCTEILEMISAHHLKYKEVGIKVEYSDYSGSKKVRPQIRMGWRLLLNKLLK